MNLIRPTPIIGRVSSGVNVSELFKVHLFTGTATTHTEVTGINMSDNGGAIFFKRRNVDTKWAILDTARGVGVPAPGGAMWQDNAVETASTGGNNYNEAFKAFASNGFELDDNGSSPYNAFQINLSQSGTPFAAFNFRKATGFFDIVTYTGNGAANRAINHNLGSVPGMILVKRRDTASQSNWMVYHSSEGATKYGIMDSTQAFGSASYFGTTPTSTQFYVNNLGYTNENGATYVAYLFASDPAGVIQCGDFTTDGSGNATVSLGWEPQFLITKNAAGTSDYRVFDTTRGWTSGTGDVLLSLNAITAETTGTNFGEPTSTGFTIAGHSTSVKHVYMAIKKP